MTSVRAAHPGLLRCRVIGATPIRDYLTRESVQPGGEVVLAVRLPGVKRPAPDESVIDALVACGAVEVLGPYIGGKPAKVKG